MRRDHDDLDRALRAMVDPSTPDGERSNMLDVFRLALACHVLAESRVIGSLVTLVRPPPSLRILLAQLGREHASQQLAAERLAASDPSTPAWLTGALELRVLVLDHAKREDLIRHVIDDVVPRSIHRGLVAQYVTERMTALSTTSPMTLAKKLYVA